MGISKKLTSKSGLTIPKTLRFDCGFAPGMAVDLEQTAEGILVKKHVPVCRFCGLAEGVQSIWKMEICPACAQKLKDEVNKIYGH